MRLVRLGSGSGVLLGVVLVIVALVRVVDVFAGVVFVPVALVDVVHMAGLVPVVLVTIALVDVMNMFASVMFVFVALVGVVACSYHFAGLHHRVCLPCPTKLYQIARFVKSN